MTTLTGIYNLPAIKCAFFIVSFLEDVSGKQTSSPEHDKRIRQIEHILSSKNHTFPKASQLWKYIVVEQRDFLLALEQSMPREIGETNQSCYIPEHLELLTINLLKTPLDRLRPYETPKVLSCIPDEDIIEVFI